MPEQFKGGEKFKVFSKEDIIKIQYLVGKIRITTEWGLAAFTHTSEEEDMLNKAKDAMKEVEAMLDVPKATIHPKVFGPAPELGETFSPDDLQKLRADLGVIMEEVDKWDIRMGDKSAEEIINLREAKESFEELKSIL